MVLPRMPADTVRQAVPLERGQQQRLLTGHDSYTLNLTLPRERGQRRLVGVGQADQT